VFVAADTIQSIYEVIQVRPTWNIWYIQDPEFQKLRLGSFTHSQITRGPLETQRAWQILTQAEITMMRFAKKLVGAGSTNLMTLLKALRGNTDITSRSYNGEEELVVI